MSLIGHFTPSGEQFIGLLAVAATFVMFAAIGGLVGGARRFSPADPFVGWGVVNVVVTTLGVFGPVPFTWLFSSIWLAAIPCAYLSWRRGIEQGAGVSAFDSTWRVWGRVGALSLPFIMLAASMAASQWDEFSQWLPNAQYIFRYDSFPRNDLPPSPSSFAAYPYALPIITYFASRLAGGFVENAGSLSNLFLLLFYAPIFLHLVRRGLKAGPGWTTT